MSDVRESEVRRLVREVVERSMAMPSAAPASVPAAREVSARVAIGADHGGFALKEILKRFLVEDMGLDVYDCGTYATEAVDYPDFAAAVARQVASGRARRGIVVDAAGIGSAMAANKIAGVRCAVCHDDAAVLNAREHNDANLLSLGARVVNRGLACRMVRLFLVTSFGGGRHERRVRKIMALEGGDEAVKLNQRIIQRLPKAEIHCHLDGCLRPRTFMELATEQGVELPAKNLKKITYLLEAGRRTRDLADYLKIFDYTLSVMQNEDALRRVACELAEDVAAENVRHLEVRFSPILHRKKKLSFERIVDAVIEGLSEAGERNNMTTGVIICGIRSLDPKYSLALAELALAYKGRGVLAFDLAGQEKDYPAKAHRAAFQLILKNNINSTVHAGEAFGPASIAQALHYCGAHRIGHGTLLHKDPDLMRYVNDHRIPLEVCLSSNVQTRAVQSIKEHPFHFYFKEGLRVTLNTDSRLISATTVSKEIALAVKAFRLSPYEVKRIIINGFKSAFLPYSRKARVLREVNLEIDRIFMEEFPDEYDLRGSF